MVRDLVTFNARAESVANDSSVTLGELMDDMGLGRWFRDYYLTSDLGRDLVHAQGRDHGFPRAGAGAVLPQPSTCCRRRASTSGTRCRAARSNTSRGWNARWSPRAWISAWPRPIETVKRTALGVEIRREGHWEVFDEVVFATHSDDSLAMLADPHADRKVPHWAPCAISPTPRCCMPTPAPMPKRRVTWSSWNYTEREGHEGGPIDLTYWMNCLQPIPESDPLFVTLEQPRADRRELDL